MNWEYRVVRAKTGIGYMYGIHEYYPDVDGRPTITEKPVDPHGETPEELRVDLEFMLRALEKPVLNAEDF